MTETTHSLTQAVLDAPAWRNIGPHRGGRVVAVAGDVSTRGQFYFGACAGGVWKTSDSGITWRNVSDGFFGTAAIGALAVSESDPNVIYAGTGETSIRNQVSHGDGVYKSVDGGRTWRNMGLRDTRHIGKIQIHPKDPDTVYVAALGHAFGSNEERGVFRSRDGGETWDRVFHRSDISGTHDLAMDLNNPRILYAPSWQVRRYPHALVSGGEECGLHRSFDGGDTWEEISRRPGLPTGLLGKIGVATSRAKPGRVWALIEAEDGALFRSEDYGETWTRLSEEALLRTRPWYYMHVTADPVDADTVYIQNYGIWKSTDGGATVAQLPTMHGDEHALWIHPHDNRTMIKGDDGGGCVSHNAGVTWSTIFNQPTAQIYHVITDDAAPHYRVYGSQQDNTAITLPSATDEVGIDERTWYAPGGGESGYIGIKPDEPWHVVASGPVGRRAYNDIMTHYDRRTGQARNITVWPELYGWGAGADAYRFRFQWTFPIQFSPHWPHPLYVASNHIHRSDDLGSSFTVISPDLTRNDPDKLRASGGPITRDNTGAEMYCTIYALAESPLRQGLFWAGSDDGLVHLSQDSGDTWRDITPPGLPEWALISIIEASPHHEGTAYLAATRYRLDDTTPYLFRTDDYGQTWTTITTGIPDNEFTRVIRADPSRPGLLFAGTETGLYVSTDDGGSWRRMGGGLPVVPVYDLAIKGDELVVATHGRSFWILDDLTPLRELATSEGDSTDGRLFPPRSRFRVRRAEIDPTSATPGHTNYANADTSPVLWDTVTGPDGEPAVRLLTAGTNPPCGTVITYLLPDEPVSDLAISFHGADGTELCRFTHGAESGPKVPARAGINRFRWDLRTPGATSLDGVSLSTWERPNGPMIVPGDYEVRLTVNGQTVSQPLTILPDPRNTAPAEDLAAQREMLQAVIDALSRTNDTIIAVERVREQAIGWTKRSSDPAIKKAAQAVIDALDPIRPRLIDVNIHQSQLWPSGLHEKLNAMFESVDSADFAPPAQAREAFAKLTTDLDEAVAAVEAVMSGEVARLNDTLRESGAAYVA
ncbi:MAG TPA: glycosyl hydrolase [Thermomicrobiales bacterium]|jgi:photosystem II stability/assembly factor-like uncharacterized protein|nr:glycosyl hydrolase [Thermomicrobiales bacterium]